MFKKQILKPIALLLIILTMMSNFSVVFASNDVGVNNYQVDVIEDSENQKVTSVSHEEFTYTIIKDIEENTIQTIIVNNETGETSVGEKVQSNSFNPKTRASMYENTFTNYEFTINFGKPDEWELRRPKSLTSTYYFKTYADASNESDLEAFKDSILAINSKESEIFWALGAVAGADVLAAIVSAGAIASGGTLSPAAVQSIMVAVGANAAYYAIVNAWEIECSNAYYYYYEVFYNSSTIFY